MTGEQICNMLESQMLRGGFGAVHMTAEAASEYRDYLRRDGFVSHSGAGLHFYGKPVIADLPEGHDPPVVTGRAS